MSPVSHFEDAEGLVKALSNDDLAALNAILKPAENPKQNHHAKITLYDAKSGDNFVTIENQIAKVDDKNEVKFEAVQLTRYLKISQSVADTLKSSH